MRGGLSSKPPALPGWASASARLLSRRSHVDSFRSSAGHTPAGRDGGRRADFLGGTRMRTQFATGEDGRGVADRQNAGSAPLHFRGQLGRSGAGGHAGDSTHVAGNAPRYGALRALSSAESKRLCPPDDASEALRPATARAHSVLEIQLLGRRHLGVLVVIIFMSVFGTGKFGPAAAGPPVRHHRRPRHRKDAVVFDSKFEL